MRKQQESTLLLMIFMALIATILFLPGLISAGSLEPSAPPGSTMKTLDEILPTWSQKLPASERFELVLDDEAVLDKETGLVWARDGYLIGARNWQSATNYCYWVIIGGRKGWRLPTVEELESLVEYTQGVQGLPNGHPFTNVQSAYYWSSTTHEADSSMAYGMRVIDGASNLSGKNNSYYMLPVRGGN